MSASQAGFRKGRSTADIVSAYRWLAAKVIRFESLIHILGLDMSRAFDIYLESALREVRAESIPRPAADLGLPLEAIYADDTDIISTSKAYLKSLEGLIPPTIGRRKLQAKLANSVK